MDGKFIIPGIYTAKNQRWNLLAFNDTPHIQFVYRENIIVKSRDIFTAETDNFESVNKRNTSLREILDNSKSPTERDFRWQNVISERHFSGVPTLTSFQMTRKKYTREK